MYMDIDKLKRYADYELENYRIRRETTEAKNVVKNREQGRDIVMSDYFKTLREPLIDQQKKTDEKQDKLIEQLKENQKAITSGLVLPYSEQVKRLDMPGTEGEQPPRMVSDMNKGFTEEELAVIQKHDLPLPGDVFLETIKDPTIVGEVLRESAIINKELGLEKGHLSTTKTAKKKNKDKIAEYDKQIAAIQKYRKRIGIIEEGKKTLKTGSGYTQPKRNAYKINKDHYGGLLIDMPELMNRMKLKAFRGGKLVYSSDVDKSFMDLVTKRFNPKKSYSLLAARVFNDLNQLANMPKHKSSGKSRIIGSSVMYYQDPKQLADRMKIIIGSMMAGNNSPVLKNDLSMINDEMLRIGAIDKMMHQKLYNKYGKI